MTKFQQFINTLNIAEYRVFRSECLKQIVGQRDCPITAQTFSNWENGKCEPDIDTLRGINRREEVDRIAFSLFGRKVYG